MVGKHISIYGMMSDYNVNLNGEAFNYDPNNHFKMDFEKLPSLINQKLVKRYKKKETILAYEFTKYEYKVGKETTFSYWVADDNKRSSGQAHEVLNKWIIASTQGSGN